MAISNDMMTAAEFQAFTRGQTRWRDVSLDRVPLKPTRATQEPTVQRRLSASISPVEVGEADRLRAHVQALAKRHGWLGQETWNASGQDRGWHCTLLKPGRLLFVTWRPRGFVPTTTDTQWQAALQPLQPAVQSVTWTINDLAQITEILAG